VGAPGWPGESVAEDMVRSFTGAKYATAEARGICAEVLVNEQPRKQGHQTRNSLDSEPGRGPGGNERIKVELLEWGSGHRRLNVTRCTVATHL